MDNKKFIFGVIALLLLMIGGTYAYYKWSSTENTFADRTQRG